MVDFLTEPVSHEEARKFIAGKTVVSKRVFDNMLPELRGKAFVVSGVEDAGLVQRIRDRIADLPQGGDWDDIRDEIAGDLTPFFVDPQAGGDVMAKQIEAAERRAELLVRTHGFQAYAATRYQEQVANTDIQPFWQYRAFGDGRVRESHQALDGVVLPADDAFWKDHYPPWEFGCRCIVIGLSPEAVEEIRAEDVDKAPDERRVIEGEFLKALHERKTLLRGPNKVVDVRSPVDKAEGAAGQNLAYRWRPGELKPDLAQLKGRYSPEVWAEFERFAKATDVGDGRTVWEWAAGSVERRAKSKEGSLPRMARRYADGDATERKPVRQLKPKQAVLPEPSTSVPPRASPVGGKWAVSATHPQAELLRRAARNMDRVHDEGTMPALTVDAKAGEHWGVYRPGRDEVSVSADAPRPMLTAAHEAGHALARKALHGGTYDGSGLHNDFAGFRQAVRASAAYQEMKRSRFEKKIYYLSWPELWARAYSQYVGVRSGDAQMLANVRAVLDGKHRLTQWEPDDFQLIAEAIDAMFARKGWR